MVKSRGLWGRGLRRGRAAGMLCGWRGGGGSAAWVGCVDELIKVVTRNLYGGQYGVASGKGSNH